MQIGDRIKYERKKRQISQQQLANHLNISRQAVSRWENNISLPDFHTIVSIADYFDMSLELFNQDVQSIESVEDKKVISQKEKRELAIRRATPYILVLVVILTLIASLPSKVKVPIFFFGTLFIIFLISCLLIYYVIKNYLSGK